jgi:hypothetical protein
MNEERDELVNIKGICLFGRLHCVGCVVFGVSHFMVLGGREGNAEETFVTHKTVLIRVKELDSTTHE